MDQHLSAGDVSPLKKSLTPIFFHTVLPWPLSTHEKFQEVAV
jgi:hypothetical protein